METVCLYCVLQMASQNQNSFGCLMRQTVEFLEMSYKLTMQFCQTVENMFV
jgi:hypothetical protein